VALTKRTKLYFVLLAMIVLAILALVIWHAVSGGGIAEAPAAVQAGQSAERSLPVKLIEVEKTITTEMISEKLRNVGLLITQEYAFTEVVSFSSVKTLFHLDLPFTESSFVASYDGVVTAGIDFSEIRVEKDDEQKSIRVYLPHPEILNVDVDPRSFQLYSEKDGLWNPISITDFNDSLIGLEDTAREKAIDKGVLVNAGSNARLLVTNLIGGLIDTSEYAILCLYE
jgi:hypothetical protein